jgi:hypothetical protein
MHGYHPFELSSRGNHTAAMQREFFSPTQIARAALQMLDFQS